MVRIDMCLRFDGLSSLARKKPKPTVSSCLGFRELRNIGGFVYAGFMELPDIILARNPPVFLQQIWLILDYRD